MTRTVVVFGAGGGVGRALTANLAQQGHRVIGVGRDAGKLDGLPLAGKFICDVTDGAALGAVCKDIVQQFPQIDGICYAIGSIVIKPLKAAREQDYLDAFRLNVVGAAESVRLLQPGLTANSSIVLFSTVAVGQGFGSHSIIASAKGGVEGLTLSLAAELAPMTRVNCIAPSLTQTPLATQLTKSETMAAAIAGMHPIPRLGQPDDIAGLAAFLLSEQAAWITGQVIGVDGGRSTLRPKG